MPQTDIRNIAEGVRKSLLVMLQSERTEACCDAPMRTDFFECATAALKSLEAFLRALDGEHARSIPDPDEISPAMVYELLTKSPEELHYPDSAGQELTELRAKILLDAVDVHRNELALMNRFAEAYPEGDKERFAAAIEFAKEAHKAQFRDSGEPYIVHPLAVSGMIIEMGMDEESAITGLLHDSVEDNEAIHLSMVAEKFGPAIAALVDGVTKLTKVSLGHVTREQQQAENVRKMFLAMAKDMRVIPIKLADRLHNMRTLEYCLSKKRVRKAKETLEIYAPLAHRLGMGQMKSELEDLAFMHINPQEFKSLRERVRRMQVERSAYLNESMNAIREKLKENGIDATLNGRPKHLYSVYRKMQKQNITFEEVYDLIAIRVIVNTVEECYTVLGLVHSMWRPLPFRIKDYISTPKPNGYKSLHTTLMGENGASFEVQIRTTEMHKQAEFGIAAHWRYKEGRQESSDLDVVMDWVRQIMEERVEDSDEFMRMLKFDFFSDYVFVFTPKGEIIDLPTGATPIDFAYRIHSEVGHRCIGAKVNGRIVTLDYTLQMGDIVEIITSSSLVGPSRDWLNIVKTQQAKSKIRSFFKKERKEENIERGRDMLAAEAKRQGYSLVQLMKPEAITGLLRRMSIASAEELYASVGYGSLAVNQVLPKLIEEFKKQQEDQEPADSALIEKLTTKQQKKRKGSSNGVIVDGYEDMVVHIAKCCTPVPGDEIVGYVTRGRGVSVHRSDCKNLMNMSENDARWIKVEWAENAKGGGFAAQIQLVAHERVGLVMDISQIFMGMNMSIARFSAKTDKNMTANITMEFDVHDTDQLQFVIKQLKRVRGVTDVYRIKG
jgi:guanosine-3',5'-bis(diphosphate) 3'-pyrophosphohydrolase